MIPILASICNGVKGFPKILYRFWRDARWAMRCHRHREINFTSDQVKTQ